MSFLAPLYLLGLAAVSLPIFFHLIRRTPRGQMLFSSLMFLTPSPPRLTKRSRLDNILLLLLRAAAIILLAFAFCRPFFRQSVQAEANDVTGRQIAILVDTSASMQRDGLWERVVKSVNEAIEELEPGDDVALLSFDHSVQTLVSFETTRELNPSERRILLKETISKLSPTWYGSHVAGAIASTADLMESSLKEDASDLDIVSQILLVSDMQRGESFEALQEYDWPASVRVSLREIVSDAKTNASPRVIQGGEDLESVVATGKNRIRVANSGESNGSQFEVDWSYSDSGTGTGRSEQTQGWDVNIPPGQQRVVKVDAPDAERRLTGIRLVGDDHDFDNTYYVAFPPRREIRVAFWGTEPADETEGLFYYLKRALPDQSLHDFVIESVPEESDFAFDLVPNLIVVSKRISATQNEQLKRYLEKGGRVLLVLKDVETGEAVSTLTGNERVEIVDGDVDDYVLIGGVDFQHPLFSPFADPRYSDFTRFHFWHYRKLNNIDESEMRILARFDDGSPYLLQQEIGDGSLFVMTSGWQPDDSQLARSTKFVPLILGMIHLGEIEMSDQTLNVGDVISLVGFESIHVDIEVTKPDGSKRMVPTGSQEFRETDQPGIYKVQAGDVQHLLAVNLQPSESETMPLELDDFEKVGVVIGDQPSSAELIRRQQQLRDIELEKRQKAWRWLIVAAIGLLIVESLLAGSLAKKGQAAVA